jgi:protein-disulfide isomerase
MKNFIYLILVLVLFTGTSVNADDKLSKEAIKVLEPTADDIVIGEESSPLTIVEYASLSCGHCAAFHSDVLPYLEKNYISTGKLKLIFRHFPLNAQALKATTLVECLNSNKKKQKFIKTLFKSIEKWAYNKDFLNKLKNIAKLGGVKGERFDQCMADKKLEERILKVRLDASNILKVQSTPTLFLNGEKIKAHNNEEFGKILDSKL